MDRPKRPFSPIDIGVDSPHRDRRRRRSDGAAAAEDYERRNIFDESNVGESSTSAATEPGQRQDTMCNVSYPPHVSETTEVEHASPQYGHQYFVTPESRSVLGQEDHWHHGQYSSRYHQKQVDSSIGFVDTPQTESTGGRLPRQFHSRESTQYHQNPKENHSRTHTFNPQLYRKQSPLPTNKSSSDVGVYERQSSRKDSKEATKYISSPPPQGAFKLATDIKETTRLPDNIASNIGFDEKQISKQTTPMDRSAPRSSAFTTVSHRESRAPEYEMNISRGKSPTKIAAFLLKTYKMINECDPKVATWTANGDAFLIKDQETLASTFIPKYFEHNNFASFSRQLHFYAFTRIVQKPVLNPTQKEAEIANQVTFRHENFLRDRPDLLQYMQRSTSNKGNKLKLERTTEALQVEVDVIKKRMDEIESKLTSISAMFESRFDKIEQMLEILKKNLSTGSQVDPNVEGNDRTGNEPKEIASASTEIIRVQSCSDENIIKEPPTIQRHTTDEIPPLLEPSLLGFGEKEENIECAKEGLE